MEEANYEQVAKWIANIRFDRKGLVSVAKGGIIEYCKSDICSKYKEKKWI